MRRPGLGTRRGAARQAWRRGQGPRKRGPTATQALARLAWSEASASRLSSAASLAALPFEGVLLHDHVPGSRGGAHDAARSRLAAIKSHGWEARLAWDDSVTSEAHDFFPHVAVIDTSDLAAAMQAGRALRSHGTHGMPLLFITSDKRTSDTIRRGVPVATCVSDKEYMGELWQMPAAQDYQA